MFVKPLKGLRILRPDTFTQLRECGEDVPSTSFWLRRLKAGDVYIPSAEVKEDESPKAKADQVDNSEAEKYVQQELAKEESEIIEKSKRSKKSKSIKQEVE